MFYRDRKSSSFDQAASHVFLKPPGALELDDYLDRCTGCGDCVEVCPARALQLSPQGFAMLTNPKKCLNCGLCADICIRKAIEFTQKTAAGFKLVLEMERSSHHW